MTPGRPFGRRARVAVPSLSLAAAIAVAAACRDVGTDPNAAVSIAFDSLPAPAVVVQDTLRDDSTGVAMPLTARAFNGRNEPIPNASFEFFVRDTGNPASVVPGNFVVGGPKARGDSVTVVASLGNLQMGRGIFVVPRPDSVLPGLDSIPSKALLQPDSVSNLTAPLPVRVMHDSLGTDSVAVRGWVVFFKVERAAPMIADSVRLADASGRLKTADTTDATGEASVQVRVFAKPAAPTPPGQDPEDVTDSVVVSAVARYKGADVAPGPRRVVVKVFGFKP